MRKLTEKQKRFADYYIELGNAEEAAKRAGYSARGNTTKLLHNTTIRAYIQQRLAEKDKEGFKKLSQSNNYNYYQFLLGSLKTLKEFEIKK